MLRDSVTQHEPDAKVFSDEKFETIIPQPKSNDVSAVEQRKQLFQWRQRAGRRSAGLDRFREQTLARSPANQIRSQVQDVYRAALKTSVK